MPYFLKQSPIQRFHIFIPAPENIFHKKNFRILKTFQKKFWKRKKFQKIFSRNFPDRKKNFKKFFQLRKNFQKKIHARKIFRKIIKKSGQKIPAAGLRENQESI
jgi:hypothetical protein